MIPNLSDREILARTLQAEAGNQGLQGMLAAGSVIMNRVNLPGYGNGLQDVILKPGQFSAWNKLTGYAGGAQGQDMLGMTPSEQAYKVAEMLLSGKYEDPTKGATHYYNPDISNPSWGRQAGGDWLKIGAHIFGTPYGRPTAIKEEPVMNGPASTTAPNVGAPLSINQPQPQQRSGGLLSGILGNRGSISGGILGALGMDEDQADRFRMAILAGTGDARMAPLIQATQARMQERRATRNVNKTVDWLRKNVSEEVAQAVANNPGIASNVMSSVLAQRLRPTEAKSSSMIMTGAEIMQIMPGITDLNPSAPYTVKRKDGQITDIDAVGGVATEPSAFEVEKEKSDVKELVEYRKVGATASRSRMQIDRLSDLLDRSETGVIAGLGSLAAQFGVDFRGDAAAAAEAIIAQLVPQQRPPGSGVISDKDLELYKASLPRISNRPGGNKLIIESMIALVEHDIKVGEIAQKALNQEITPAEAYAQMSALADPFASVKPFYGAAPDGKTLTREGAMDVLKGAGVIDGQ
jgi:hypothetical protein